MFQIVWAANRGIYDGPLCTAQAAMLLFGDNGTAFWNAVIGIHTFWTVVLGKSSLPLVMTGSLTAPTLHNRQAYVYSSRCLSHRNRMDDVRYSEYVCQQLLPIGCRN